MQSGCVPLSLWACQPDGESVGLAARQRPPWNSLLRGSNRWMSCVLDGLSLTYHTHPHTHTLTHAHTGSLSWSFLTGIEDRPFCSLAPPLLQGNDPPGRCTPDNGASFCMAAYLTHDNAARCPGLILSERPTDFIQLLNSPMRTECNCGMRLAVLQAA